MLPSDADDPWLIRKQILGWTAATLDGHKRIGICIYISTAGRDGQHTEKYCMCSGKVFSQ